MSKHRNFSRNGSGKNRSFKSNGKRNSGNYVNPQQVLQKSKQAKEKYITLAREALSAGDRIEAENYFQHADHYTRIINSLNRDRNIAEQESQLITQNTDNQCQEPVEIESLASGDVDVGPLNTELEVESVVETFGEVAPGYQPHIKQPTEELMTADT